MDIGLEVTRRYNVDEVVTTAASALQADLPDERSGDDGQLVSAFVRARKPANPQQFFREKECDSALFLSVLALLSCAYVTGTDALLAPLGFDLPAGDIPQ